MSDKMYITLLFVMMLSSNIGYTDTKQFRLMKRFLLQDKAISGHCHVDIVKSYPNEVIVTSSSELYHDDKTHDLSASRGMLDTKEETTSDGITHMGAWSANFNDHRQFLQFEMKKNFSVEGVVTQGRNGCCQEWVTSYRVLYSSDCNEFRVLDGQNGTIMSGNNDEDTKVTNKFESPITSKCIRIMPFQFHKHISMRVGLFGYVSHPGTACASTTIDMAATSSNPTFTLTTEVTSIISGNKLKGSTTVKPPTPSTGWIPIPGR